MNNTNAYYGFKIGTILDFTREGDDSPFIGIVVYDHDLDRKVLYEQNGGFSYLEELAGKDYIYIRDIYITS